jgi:hypothetical protein
MIKEFISERSLIVGGIFRPARVVEAGLALT